MRASANEPRANGAAALLHILPVTPMLPAPSAANGVEILVATVGG